MTACINAQMPVEALVDLLQLPKVSAYEVTGVETLRDIGRIQAYCDALHLVASWQIDRHCRKITLTVTRPTPTLFRMDAA